jgi:hypothetical protein
MARINATNYANPGFQYATVDNEQFDRTDVAGVGQSLDLHDHSVGNGLPVTRIAIGTVSTAVLADGAVTTVKLGDSQVTSVKIADGTIVAGDIANTTITQAKLANSSVGTAQLIDANVTTVKIADANVTQVKLSTGSVGTAQLVDGSVTGAKLASPLSISGDVTIVGQLFASNLWTTTNVLGLGTATGSKWLIVESFGGHLSPFASDTYDLGTSSMRVRNVWVSGAVVNRTKAGAPVDADFTAATDGMLAVDTTNSRLYVRVGGTWKFAVLT